jgi:hypothetical protein
MTISIAVYMLPFQMENGKRNPRRFSLIRLPFFCANGSLSFVHLFIDKERNGSCPFANRLNGHNGLNGLAHLFKFEAYSV